MMNRRLFNKILVGTIALSLSACSSVMSVNPYSSKQRVVVVGGGFGGATAAKYLKKFDSSLEVVLIEQNEFYYTCPFGNTVIAGMNDLEYIKHDYKTLASKHGIKVIHEKVAKIDGANHKVILENGEGNYICKSDSISWY